MVVVEVEVVQQCSTVAIAASPDTIYTLVKKIKKCPIYIILNDFNWLSILWWINWGKKVYNAKKLTARLFWPLVCHPRYNLLLYISYRTPFILFVSHFINKLIFERNWIAQEVCYHLLNLFLIESNHIVLNINYCPLSRHIRSTIINEEEIYKMTSIYKKYTAYNASWIDSSYFYIFI